MTEHIHLYAVAIMAKRNIENGVVVSMQSGVAAESTTSNAEAVALRECKKRFPASEGYYDHGVSVGIADEEALKKAGWEKVKL